MYLIYSCLTDLHHPGLVIMAALLCVLGTFITMRLYRRAKDTARIQKAGWCVLAAGTAGEPSGQRTSSPCWAIAPAFPSSLIPR